MPAATPNITLTATLLDYSGVKIGSATQPAWLRICLAGFSSALPRVKATGNLAKISSWFIDIPYDGVTAISIKLWGNDQVTPAGTYYAISVLDTNKNVVQTATYVFNGTQTIDLADADPVTPPAPAGLNTLVTKQTAGSTPGTVFTIPTQISGSALIAVYVRGVFYGPTNYTLVGQTLTMHFVCTEEPFATYVEIPA